MLVTSATFLFIFTNTQVVFILPIRKLGERMAKNKMQTICCSFHCFLKYTLFCFVRTGFFLEFPLARWSKMGPPCTWSVTFRN